MRKVLFILLIVLTNISFSQTEDFQVWSSLNLRYNINKKSNINVKQSLRTFQNSTYWKLSFTEISYFYKFNKFIKISSGYRYGIANKIEYSSVKQRFLVNLHFAKEINDFKLKFRPRFQIDFDSDNGNLPVYVNRELLGLSRGINNLISVNISTEAYFAIPSIKLRPNFDGFFKYRFTFGVDFNLNEKSKVEVFYRFQHENNSLIENVYILGLSYKYEFN